MVCHKYIQLKFHNLEINHDICHISKHLLKILFCSLYKILISPNFETIHLSTAKWS
jgi:hypothetical protein